jgi:hypothetical protein
MFVFVVAFQVHREVITQRLKFGVPMAMSDLKAIVAIDISNAADAHKEDWICMGGQKFHSAKMEVLRDGDQKRNAIDKHNIHTEGDVMVPFENTGWHQIKVDIGDRGLLPRDLLWRTWGPKTSSAADTSRCSSVQSQMTFSSKDFRSLLAGNIMAFWRIQACSA